MQNGVNTALPLQFTLTNNGQWTIQTFSTTVSRQAQSGTCTFKDNFEIRIVAYEAMFEVGTAPGATFFYCINNENSQRRVHVIILDSPQWNKALYSEAPHPPAPSYPPLN